MSFHKTKKFKDLKKEWDKKLEKTGFKDIETPDGKLKNYHSVYWGIEERKERALRATGYFDLAMDVFRKHKFKNPKEKLVWLLHAKGNTVRGIEEKFEKWFTEARLGKSAAFKIIKSISKATGMRHEYE